MYKNLISSYARYLLLTILTFHGILTLAQKNGEASKPFVLGYIDEIQSKELSEKRVLNIYLPEGYKKEDSIKYPVIYLLDGSADEDFIHVTGLIQFNNFSWINRSGSATASASSPSTRTSSPTCRRRRSTSTCCCTRWTGRGRSGRGG